MQRNKPYAGGYITEHYGTPLAGTHAIQIEINRAIYMDEARLEQSPRFPQLAADMTAIIGDLAAFATGYGLKAAAE